MELEPTIDSKIATSERRIRVLAEALTGALSAVAARRTEFDVLFVLLPSAWEPAFGSASDEDFDLHDYVKAITAVRGIPMRLC